MGKIAGLRPTCPQTAHYTKKDLAEGIALTGSVETNTKNLSRSGLSWQ
jgi:hypothetical protein